MGKVGGRFLWAVWGEGSANERLSNPICKESDAGAQSVLVLSSLVMFTQGEKVGGHIGVSTTKHIGRPSLEEHTVAHCLLPSPETLSISFTRER